VARDRAGRRYTGRAISRNSITYLHVELAMPTMHLHRLRHWYATSTLEACRDLRVVQELLGHASVATTQVYTKVSNRRSRAAVAALPSLGGF
jgi:site-specific recombinase XerC